MCPPTEQSSFLKLPGELRNKIYAYLVDDTRCFCYGWTARILRSGIRVSTRCHCHNGQPPIAKVNRQIRQESLPLYYSINTFIFRLGYSETMRALEAIGDLHVCLMKEICFISYGTRVRTYEFSFAPDSSWRVVARTSGPCHRSPFDDDSLEEAVKWITTRGIPDLSVADLFSIIRYIHARGPTGFKPSRHSATECIKQAWEKKRAHQTVDPAARTKRCVMQ